MNGEVATPPWQTRPEEDRATPRGVELLFILARGLTEAEVILPLVESECALRLDDTMASIRGAAAEARAAYGAAAILQAEVPLAPSLASGPSRPRGVLARHRAAWRLGDAEISRSFTVPLPDGVVIPDVPDPPPPGPMERTPCGKPTAKATPCRKGRALLLDGREASGCHVHLDDDEVGPYRDRQAEFARWSQIWHQHRLALGEVVAQQWLDSQRR